ncbi:MAG: hypothetical protein KAH95_01340 [Spirochaetales bacterium]|nr:hypothetical protein [Spirochaetales bacterium]
MINNKTVFLSPEQKLFLGLAFVPAYLLQQSVFIRTFQFILLLSIFIYKGGKFRIMPNMILIFGIIFAYILNPAGKVIVMAGKFPVTEGALMSGLSRALMLIGLIYLSRLSVSSKLNFKGKTGNLIGRVFYYFEAITENQADFSFKNFYKSGTAKRFINYIDNLLISLETYEHKNEIKNKNGNIISSIIVFLLIFTFVLVSYILLLPLFNIK